MFIHTLFPEPVAPAIKRCGIVDKSATTAFPSILFPKAQATLHLLSLNSSDSIISLKYTGVCFLFGISRPTAALPGIGASILTSPAAASPSAISCDKLTILLTLIPDLGWISNLVTDGPLVTSNSFASTPKLKSTSSNLFELSTSSLLSSMLSSDLVFILRRSADGYA